jgi:6-phosphogluconolactonase
MPSFQYQQIPVDSTKEFIDRSSAELEQAILDAIKERGRCVMGLSGGSTPRPIYEALGQLKAIEWHKVTVFLVDERYVPADDERSNQRLVRETLLKHAPIPESRSIFPDTSLPLDECIEDYDFRIEQLMQEEIDIVILGLGEDGHIASLFPGDIDVLLEKEKHVLHTVTDTFDVKDRITVTLPVLQAANRQFFFLKGQGKKSVFGKAMAENSDPVEYPPHALLETGRSVWITYW